MATQNFGAVAVRPLLTLATSARPGGVEAIVSSTTATPSANIPRPTAIRNARRGASQPAGSTRLPPDQWVGVEFARSAARSK